MSALAAASIFTVFTFLFSNNTAITIISFGFSGFICLNVTFLKMIPSRARCKQSHALIMAAAKDPERIDDLQLGICAVKTDDGKTYKLNAVEQYAWKELVVPFLCKMHSKTLSDQKSVTGHVLTKSEMRHLHEQREAVKKDEVRLKDDRKQLDAKRQDIAALQERLVDEEKHLKQARKEIELEASSLQKAEDLVISRLSEIEVAEAQMAQMRENLAKQQTAGEPSSLADERLKHKEAEIDALRLSLKEDKSVLEQQKTELNQLKGDLIRASSTENAAVEFNPEDSLRIREQQIKAQLSQLKQATNELEERSKYVQDVENSLIDRMNTMSEREACIEQGEVNAGLRVDV